MKISVIAAILAKIIITALLIFDILAGLFVAQGGLGALGSIDDAKGWVLYVGPLSEFISLILAWIFRSKLSVWVLAVFVLTGMVWGGMLLGPASEQYVLPFFVEPFVILVWVLFYAARCLFGKRTRLRHLAAD